LNRSSGSFERRRSFCLGDEVLDPELFYTLREAHVIIERWRTEYHTFRSHSPLGHRPPAPKAFVKTFIVQNMGEMISF
jgi:transposase InsO family protein